MPLGTPTGGQGAAVVARGWGQHVPLLPGAGSSGGKRPSHRAAERSNEFARLKANAHQPLLCREPYRGRIARLKPVVLILGRLQVVGCGNRPFWTLCRIAAARPADRTSGERMASSTFWRCDNSPRTREKRLLNLAPTALEVHDETRPPHITKHYRQ